MSEPRPVPTDPRSLAVLPLLYVAWADGELDEEELAALRAGLVNRGVEPELGVWLDPADPPGAEDLARLLAALRAAAAGLERAERRTLVELGEALARGAGHVTEPVERAALAELEKALGLGAVASSTRLLVPVRPAPAEGPAAPAGLAAALAAALAEPHAGLRRDVLAHLAARGATAPLELDRAAYRDWVLERCRELAARGWGALSYPPEAGGEGGAEGVGRFVAVFETLAHGDLSLLVKFGVQFGLFGGSILQLGSSRHHQEYLPAIGRLELPGCFAMTETGHGSNVAEIETTATYDPARDELVIHTPHAQARKDYIGNAAAHGRLATVFAQLEVGGLAHGVHAVLVPIRDPSGAPAPRVTIEDDGPKLGLLGVDNGRLAFDHVRVPRANLLDRFGSIDDQGRYQSAIASPDRRFFTMLGTLVGGRVSVALAALSAAKSALSIAVCYGAERRQFGPEGEAEVVILDYLAHQRRLLPRLARTYALHAALRELAAAYAASVSGEDRRELETLAAGLKAVATWHTTDTIQTCREACGGWGYLAENRFAALKADTDVFTTFEGDNTVLLQLVAKGLLSGYRRQLGEMSPLGLVRWVLQRAAEDFAEHLPWVTGRTDVDHLRDPEFHRDVLTWREKRVLHTLGQRIKNRLERGATPFDALNACQDHALEAATAFVDRVVFDAWQRWSERQAPELQPQLARLGALHALSTLDSQGAFYLAHGVFDGDKWRAVRTQINQLCGELRPDAVGLVTAFGARSPR